MFTTSAQDFLSVVMVVRCAEDFVFIEDSCCLGAVNFPLSGDYGPIIILFFDLIFLQREGEVNTFNSQLIGL